MTASAIARLDIPAGDCITLPSTRSHEVYSRSRPPPERVPSAQRSELLGRPAIVRRRFVSRRDAEEQRFTKRPRDEIDADGQLRGDRADEPCLAPGPLAVPYRRRESGRH